MGEIMNLVTATHYAEKCFAWLLPYCQKQHLNGSIAVAGSVRRRRPACNDVDLVCIPERIEERDMLGAVIRSENLLVKFLQEYVAKSSGARFLSGGERHDGKLMSIQLPKCQLDVFFAEPENFGSRLLCRTGSKEHNIYIVEHAKRRGDCWKPYEGVFTGGEWRKSNGQDVYVGGRCIAGATEAEIFTALDLPFIEPERRER